MGLDMHFKSVSNGISEEICYFRKHADLNGFLQELWLEKHPDKSPDDFNCTDFRITKEILNKLKKFVNTPDNSRKTYCGFFWGQSDSDKWERTRELLEEIERRIKNRERIIYYAWW